MWFLKYNYDNKKTPCNLTYELFGAQLNYISLWVEACYKKCISNVYD